MLHNLIPSIAASLSSSDIPFSCFSEIDQLYNIGLVLKEEGQDVQNPLVGPLMRQIFSVRDQLLKYETPAIIKSKFLTHGIESLDEKFNVVKHCIVCALLW